MCKVMKRFANETIVGHLIIITSSQHGFTRGRSCLTDLLEFFEEIYARIDEGKLKDVIYLEFYYGI